MALAGWHLRELQRPGFIHGVGAQRIVRVGEPDVLSLVVREVEVVATERLLQPPRSTDQRGAVDVLAIRTLEHVRADDRIGSGANRGHGMRLICGAGPRLARPGNTYAQQRDRAQSLHWPELNTGVIPRPFRPSSRRPMRLHVD